VDMARHGSSTFGSVAGNGAAGDAAVAAVRA
jgi:hypothetical protein